MGLRQPHRRPQPPRQRPRPRAARPALAPLPPGALAALSGALERPDVPILVQAHDWAELPERFRRRIECDHVVLAAAE